MVALQWGDIQFGASENDPNRYIFVQHNYVNRQFTTPKSKKNRRVDLSRQLRRALLELRDQRLFKAFGEGKAAIADDLVFPSPQGAALLVFGKSLGLTTLTPTRSSHAVMSLKGHPWRGLWRTRNLQSFSDIRPPTSPKMFVSKMGLSLTRFSAPQN